METETMTLTDFLLARIAEDEAIAREVQGDHLQLHGAPQFFNGYVGSDLTYSMVGESQIPMVTIDPARVLAECEAKRRIVAWASDGEGEFHWSTVLAPLAVVYADHPDYREEWRA